jgi:hypothetical protein
MAFSLTTPPLTDKTTSVPPLSAVHTRLFPFFQGRGYDNLYNKYLHLMEGWL